MNREIKFRAWDGKKMYLPEYTDKEDFHLLADGTIVETHEYGVERHELTSRRGDNWKVMQYTGLKDKNGKEIYEGDIVGGATHPQLIKWDTRTTTQYGHGDSTTTVFIGFSYGDWGKTAPEIEVIGNIYENPELLT